MSGICSHLSVRVLITWTRMIVIKINIAPIIKDLPFRRTKKPAIKGNIVTGINIQPKLMGMISNGLPININDGTMADSAWENKIDINIKPITINNAVNIAAIPWWK
jgi:hypothetical protein